MKRVITTLAFLFGITIIVNAQTKQEQAVAAAVEQLRLAMVNADKAELEKLAHEKLSYGHSGGKVEDKNSFVTNIVSGNSDFVTIDLSEQTITISGKTAIVRHVLKAKTNDAGKGPAEVHLKILLVWEKGKGGWKLLARQAVKMP